jgi:SAM-dependent methyltransferase
MQERHRDRKIYFEEQGITTKKYVIPYIEEILPITKDIRILEIGCGEGGNLIPFIEKGCEVAGVDISKSQIENAKKFINEKFPNSQVTLLSINIYDLSPENIGNFDLILMRDVIEHIHNQDKFLQHLKNFLKPNGIVFFGFPPWRMPFGGHQQICKSKILSKMPYYHLFPRFLYRATLKIFGENKTTIDELLEIKETGIGINKFQKIVEKNGYKFVKKTFYLINPNYETKFGLKPRKQIGLIKIIPFFRDFLTTSVYCIIKSNHVQN